MTDIHTPERTLLSCRLAGPAQRATAYLLDLLVRAAVLVVLFVMAAGLGLSESALSGAGTGVVFLTLFVVEWGYYVACEVLMQGQSFGKRALRLRVVCSDGLPLGFGESVLRNLLRAADFVPNLYVLGALVMSIDPKLRRLGDLVAGTLVVSEGSERVLPTIALQPSPTHAELSALPARVAFSPTELDAVEHFMRRRSTLSPLRQAELAELLAPVVARRMSLTYSDPVRFIGLLYHRATQAGRA